MFLDLLSAALKRILPQRGRRFWISCGLLFLLLPSYAKAQPDLAEQSLAIYLATYLASSRPRMVAVNDYGSVAKPMTREEDLVAFRQLVHDKAYFTDAQSLSTYRWTDVWTLAEKGILQWEIASDQQTVSFWKFPGTEGLVPWGHGNPSDPEASVTEPPFKRLESKRLPDPSTLGPEWKDFLSAVRRMAFDSYMIFGTRRKNSPLAFPAEALTPELEVLMEEVRLLQMKRPTHHLMAVGAGQDAQGAFLGFIWRYALAGDMEGEEAVLRDHYLNHVSLTRGFKLNDLFDVSGASFQRRGDVVFSRFYSRDKAPNRLWYLSMKQGLYLF